MDDKDYLKIATVVGNDYTIMMKMLESIDPKKGITAKTLPILEIVRRVFIDALEKNISAIFQAKAIEKAMTEEGIKDNEASCEIESTTDTNYLGFYE